MQKLFLFTLSVIVFICFAFTSIKAASDPPFNSMEAEKWADSILHTLNREERIAQLIMISAWSNKDSSHINEIKNTISKYKIGGLVFFQGGPVREALLTNEYQKLSKVPLWIGMDAEWGVAMRLDSTLRFPRQMTMAAITDDSVVYQMGNEIGRNCRRLGININFAPDADINNNPLNPVIGSRSFGDDRNSVARKSVSYMLALQNNHVLATGKHFPGHGNANTDSHLTLPMIDKDTAELDSIELYPFRELIAGGIGGMMVAHLNIPSLDSTPEIPSTLSRPIVTELLKDKMGFNGLIFTDALNMKGVNVCYKPGIIEKLALAAGNDVLVLTEDIPKALKEIHLAIENCEITKEQLDSSVKKILIAKYWCGLNKSKYIDTTNLIADLNTPEGKLLQRKLYEKSVTVLINKESILPFHSNTKTRIASLAVGDELNNSFQKQLKLYGDIDFFSIDKDAPVSVFDVMYKFLSNYDYIILSLHSTNMRAADGFGIPNAAANFIDTVLIKYKTIFIDFGNAYTLSRFRNINKAKALVLAYEDFPLTHSITAQIIMGGMNASGKIPVAASENFKRDDGINTKTLNKLQYTIPEAASMSSVNLNKIDSVVTTAINACAMPGCEVLVARFGKVVYQKAFGTFTFNLNDTVQNTTIYDVASITKIAATALGAMRLYEKKKLDFDHPLYKFLPDVKNTNKKNLNLKEIMTHQAGLQAWIPFYKETISDSGLSHLIYCDTANEKYSLHVADNIYMLKSYSDTIKHKIYYSSVSEKGKYLYSDLGPIIVKEIIEKTAGKPLNEYVDENFYKPLNLARTTFNPLGKFNKNAIAPTENDTIFRDQLIHGFVHDPAAAMFGGVSGNAGVFSDANDLAVIMQMLINKGSYGGQTFFKPSTVELFTKQQYPGNRRGLLFDKPEKDTTKGSPCSKFASPATFGHQGFTGTCVWADPKYDLIYIFLSNRVNPSAANDLLNKMNVRTTIHDIIYKSLLDLDTRLN